MRHKALLVNADGTVEELNPNDAVGLYFIRPAHPCKECGAPSTKVDRKYRAHFAENHQTVRTHKEGALQREPANFGCMVFIEEPA